MIHAISWGTVQTKWDCCKEADPDQILQELYWPLNISLGNDATETILFTNGYNFPVLIGIPWENIAP